ncbi:Putative AC9 transposase [Morus notabilis]|uniref:Putative AC9 transposase n=1 Tax=Morus notabilis TaxID=981085 RepID=W9R5D5_9ROSA|nr:Putative AC9 transposase [Morus notabilis]
MASSGYGGDIPIDAQFNIEEGQFPNVFQTQESQTMERVADETANPTLGGRTRGRGRNGGGIGGRGGEANSSASASVASSKKKCKRTSAVWEHFNTFEEVNNNGRFHEVTLKLSGTYYPTSPLALGELLRMLSKKKKKTTTTQSQEESGNGSSSRGGGGFNELMAYLSEGLVIDNSEMFDLVEWWRARALTWPILTRLAMDIFSIPVSTVAAEQAFSTTARILKERRNAL